MHGQVLSENNSLIFILCNFEGYKAVGLGIDKLLNVMKKGLLAGICLLPLFGFAQSVNSWIDFSQTYYKIPVAQDGVYRLTYTDLQNAGVPVGSIDPRFIQIFHRGTQQAIYFKNDQQPADSKFDATEYLEFYGQHNDGTRDSKLYTPASAQPHSYYNIYSDTAAYFLTWNQLPVQGKRMTSFSEVNVSGLPKQTAQTSQRLSLFTSQYSGGETLSDVIQYSYFNNGEGWTGSTICTGTSGCTSFQDVIIDQLINTVTTAAGPQFEIQLMGREDLNHVAEVYVGPNTGSLRLIETQSFTNYETPTITKTLNWSDVGADGKMAVRVKALGLGGGRDLLSISYIKVNFAQGFDLTGQTQKQFTLPAGAAKSYIELTNAPASPRLWDITDPDNIITIGTASAGTTVTAIIPNTSDARTLLVSSQFITPELKKVSFRSITPSSHDFIIVTHPSLTKPALGYSDAVKAYASYRASDAGGNYDTLIVTVDQLFNQFNYGETSSLAIHEFVKFMHAGGNIKYLFFIGKGREVFANMYRRTIAASELKDLVPTGGYPASDMVYSAGLSGVAHLPAIATGRITASTPAQVAAYLNKIKEVEASSYNESWHKQVLHLSGGIQPFELSLFKQYMDGFASVAQDQYYGASVKTLGKHEATAIELINISEQVNKGVNLITFFGHSAPNATDIDIGYVSNPAMGYNNPGKYPSFLVNGCNAGEFFNNMNNFGEDWILTANKGARSFIANSSYGYSNDLKLYSDLFYQSAFADSSGIRAGVGDVQKEVAKRYLGLSSSPGINTVAISHQMILLGDPSLKLFGAGKPDFEITDNSLSATGFDGNPVEASADSFALKIVVKNSGLITRLPLKINVARTLNDNTVIPYTASYAQPLNQDTLIFNIRRGQSKSFSNNTFVVTLDPDNTIAELDEDDNQGTFVLSISGTVNLFPSAYSIVNKRNVNLVFQNSDMLSESRQYLVEMDTLPTFNSSLLRQFTVTGKVLLTQKVQLPATDSTVYYWRTRFAQASPQENDEWQTTSFSYIINGSEGWTQMHAPQFSEDVTSGLIKETPTGKLSFETTTTDIFVKTYGKDNAAPAGNAAFTINGVDYWHSIQGFDCRDNTINLVAFNKNTVVPYEGIPFTYLNAGRRACGREPQIINSFLTTETLTGLGDDLIQYVNNINSGDSVILFTLGDAGLDVWPTDVKNKMAEFGISVAQINGIIPGEPVVILGKKGAPAGTAKIIRSTLTPETEQELVLNETLTGKVSSGSLRSTLIGPAHSWKQFISRVSEKTNNDEVRFDLYGVQRDGTEVLLQANMSSTYNLSSLSATDYPHLKLVYFTKDDVDLSAAQLKKWFVFFEPVAEGILVYKGTSQQLTLQEGQTWTGNYSFVNISEKTFADSLKVEVETYNKKSLISEKRDFTIKPPAPGDSSHFQIVSKPKSGLNDVEVFVNRRIQSELYYENNTIDLVDYLNVLPDQINPVLDVTVDGRYLTNGDVVSSNPTIRLVLKDENSLFYKTDTTGVDVFLKYPCASSNCNFSRIALSGSTVKWTPASDGNDFTVVLKPVSLPEGTYTLRIQAQDASGNKAGTDPYEVTFSVKFETAVQFTAVYPNPSPADFFFRFQLAGQSELDKFTLQIWSAEGRLVNEFTEEQLTRFYVGTHELRWNARDQQGNRLSPGVYIYRMSVGANGAIESTYGKLVVVK